MNSSKKAVVCVLAVLLSVLLMSFTCAASENIGQPINLYYNDNPIYSAIHVNGTAYAPLRIIIGAIEPAASFSWNPSNAKATAAGDGIVVTAIVGKNYINANGRIIYDMSATNFNLGGTLYVPIASVAKAYSLTWSGLPASLTCYISGAPEPILNGDEFYDAESLYWLSRIISAESRGEPLEGQIAVGNVVLGRTKDGSFPNTVKGVIFDKKYGTQFTPAKTGSVYNEPTTRATLAAKIALEGYQVVDALYFCTTRVNNGSWMAKNRDYVATIGNHVFYW